MARKITATLNPKQALAHAGAVALCGGDERVYLNLAASLLKDALEQRVAGRKLCYLNPDGSLEMLNSEIFERIDKLREEN